jgi:predicted nucleotidyltransferase
MVSMGQLKEIGRQIAREFDPERIVLFGSHARGDATEISDVDLLVVARTSAPKPKRSVPIYSLLRDYPFSKDILVYTPEEVEAYRHLKASLIHRALDEGIVLYEKQA